jgi:hypothetical protein
VKRNDPAYRPLPMFPTKFGATSPQSPLRAGLCFRAMVYRCGHDPIKDVTSLCGPGNLGRVAANGGLLGHVRLKQRDHLVDFSVGNWRREAECGLTTGCCAEDGLPDGTPLPPPEWTAPPLPDYFLESWARLTTPWRPVGRPDIGEAWYGPFSGSPWKGAPLPDRELVDFVRRRLDAFEIRKRLAI